MKSIEIKKSNRQLLCDDEDYEKLAPYAWTLQRNSNGGRWQLRTYTSDGYFTPLHFLYGPLRPHGVVFSFRDGNACNYQRYNLRWTTGVEEKLCVIEISIPFCHLGSAILRPKPTDGRSLACFICAQENYPFYYRCLDLVSHKTLWKGWIRHDSE